MNNFEYIKENIETGIVNLHNLLSLEKKYIIPIYQRPYNWEENHIYELIRTLKEAEDTTVFLGNMEFKKTKKDNNNELEIIDGQQRITTLLLLLNYLNNDKYNDKKIQEMLELRISEEDEEISEKSKFVNFLNNKDTNVIKDRYNAETKKSKINKVISDFRTKNIYLLNYFFIQQALEKENIKKEDYLEFSKKILNNVYIIAVTLSEKINNSNAIKIFDVINTTGKPLETSDIFKIKIYDYAKKFNKGTGTFENINHLYSKINKENKEILNIEEKQIEEIIKKSKKERKEETNIVSETFRINDILKIYQYILIVNRKTKEYSNELYRMRLDTFYNSLFACLLNNTNKNEFNGFKEGRNKEIIKYEDLNEIFENYLEVSKMFLQIEDKEYDWISSETYFAYKMLRGGCTRYSWSYYFLPAMFYWKFNECKKEFEEFIVSITKLFEIYSMLKTQVINGIKTFTNGIIEDIIKSQKNKKEEAIKINKKIKEKLKKELYDNKTVFEEMLKGSMDSWYKKQIMCLIIAKKAEKGSNEELKKKYRYLFTKKFDIEHICARESKGIEIDDSKKDMIGNLMILEYSINRSIGNLAIKDKIKKYEGSTFSVVLNQVKGLKTKDYKNYFQERNEQSINNIIEYFYTDL